MTERPELLDATDEMIDDAVKYADPMVLRGLLYQFTGDQSLQATEVTSIQFGFLEAQVLASPAAVGLIQSKDDNRSVVEVTMDAYRRYNDELDRVEATKMYNDPRAQNYFKNEHGRSAGNLPFDIRKMWRWLRNPTDVRADAERQAAGETANDCAVVPQFGHDLVAR